MLKKIFLSLPLIFWGITRVSGQELNVDQMRVMELPPATHVCTLPPTDVNAHFYIQVNPELLNRMKEKSSSDFEVNYMSSCDGEEWPAEAVTAFEFALGIWSEHLRSDVPIVVNAEWDSLEGNTLGSARPSRLVQIPNVGDENTWYTLAQLSAMTGQALREQLDGVDYDIDMNVQCNHDDWYFGTDAEVPDGKTDFVTVVLHEIGHGIGFLGSMEADTDTETAEWGSQELNLQPIIFDRFTVDGDFNNLINTSVYPNPSAKLYNALTGNRGGVFFDGDNANNTLSEHEADRAKLYTPDPYNQGSSYSHFDQNTFRQSVNALMLPFVDRAFAIHTPGPLFCGVLADMGWPLGAGCLSFLSSEALIAVESDSLNFGVINEGETSEVTLSISNLANAEDILTGTLEVENGSFEIVSGNQFSAEPGSSAEVTISYTPQANMRDTGVLSVFHNARNESSPLTIDLFGEALEDGEVVKLDQSYPNPFVRNNSYSVDKPVIEYAISQDSDVSLDLYTISGQHVHSLVSSRMQPGRYMEFVDMGELSSGIYIYRIIVDGTAKVGKLMYIR